MSPIQSFTFESNHVRAEIGADGTPWFCAKDVCKAMGIKYTGHTLDFIKPEWKGMVYFTTPGGKQPLRTVSEAAVYKLAFKSSKPQAEAFTDWLAGDVIPTIRKTGKYEPSQPTLALPAPITKASQHELESTHLIAMNMGERIKECIQLTEALPASRDSFRVLSHLRYLSGRQQELLAHSTHLTGQLLPTGTPKLRQLVTYY